jgi:polysaccharide biosynthesis protein PslH
MNNFLSIVWYRVLPAEYGGQKGIADFNDYLGRKVTLTCLCSRNNTPGTPLSYTMLNDLPSSRFQFWNPFVRRQILSAVKKQSFSHIIIEHPWHAWLGKYKEKMGFRFIVHAHNIEHLRMKARGKLWWRLLRRTEQKAFQSADYILFKTAEDRAKAVSLFDIDPDKCLIVPYGIKEMGLPIDNSAKQKIMEQYHIYPYEKILLFAGTLDYEPNKKALDINSKHIVLALRQKGFAFRLFICGALPEEKLAELNALPHVTATGFVASLSPYLQAADVFINPVMSGSGIQTKNIDAVANGCTVVATAFAARGLPDYLINEKVFVPADDDWVAFAEAAIEASWVENIVPQPFYEEYNWERVVDRLLGKISR